MDATPEKRQPMERQQRILIVDSDERALGVIKNFLANDGLEVTTAFNGEGAIEFLRSSEYDLLLVDDHFAYLTSSCFFKQLHRTRGNTPVVVMESAPSGPCGLPPYNSLRASRVVNKWRPCEILNAAREILADSTVSKVNQPDDETV